MFDDAFGPVDILAEVLQDEFDRDRFLLLVPDIVIRDQSQHRVADFRFAAEFGLGRARHPYDIASPASVDKTLGPARKGRPFDAEICSSGVNPNP